MAIGMTRVLHVKLPVSDLAHSVQWYVALLDLELTREFVEDGELRGAALKSREGGFAFALRLREHCAGQPRLDGFDVAALHMESRDDLVRLRERCSALGVACTPIQDRGEYSAIVDVTDPDGTVLRFYWLVESQEPDSFVAVIFNGDAPPTFSSESRLELAATADAR